MMKPVLPEELSALLDGELDAVRVAEIKAQIDKDPALRQKLEALRAADAGWRAAADSLVFTPAVRLGVGERALAPGKSGGGGWLAALAISLALLLGIRALLKLSGSDAFLVSLPVLSLLLLVVMVVRLARDTLHLVDAHPEAEVTKL